MYKCEFPNPQRYTRRIRAATERILVLLLLCEIPEVQLVSSQDFCGCGGSLQTIASAPRAAVDVVSRFFSMGLENGILCAHEGRLFRLFLALSIAASPVSDEQEYAERL